MPKVRITLELDSDLVEQIEAIAPKGATVEQTIAERLGRTADYDLSGSPLFLTDAQHRRLRAISGSAVIGGPEGLLDRLEAMTRIKIEDAVLPLPVRYLERLAGRAKLEGKTPSVLAVEYAESGIRERIGL